MKRFIFSLIVFAIVALTTAQTEGNTVNKKSFFHAPSCDTWSTYNIYTNFLTGAVYAQQTRSCEYYDANGHLMGTTIEQRTINLTNA